MEQRTRRAAAIATIALAASIASPARAQCDLEWSDVGGGTDDVIWALAVFDDGSGPALYAAGSFSQAGNAPASAIARWDGSTWTPLTDDVCDGEVFALAVFDDGTGPALYAGGHFHAIGGLTAHRIAKWDGHQWSALGDGLTGRVQGVFDFATYDDGSGPALYAGGDFSNAGEVEVGNVARWDGAAWSAVGGFTNGPVIALETFGSGLDARLYAGGFFNFIGGKSISRIASWDGDEWSAVGNAKPSGPVQELQVYDDGGGPSLYATGSFGSIAPNIDGSIGRWNGQEWSGVGNGLGGFSVALGTFNDGGGEALFAGQSGIRRWHGADWQLLPPSIPGDIYEMLPFDDGSGPALFVAGGFTKADDHPAHHIIALRCPPCPADCDGTGSLDLFDFLCFTNHFNAADPSADCDGGGTLDLFDFLCFTNAFNQGC